jgi:hypothetical protein
MEAIRSPKSNMVSSSRVIAMAAGFSLSLAVLMMTVGLFFSPDFVTPLTATTPFLAAMAGTGYAVNKLSNDKADAKDTQGGA